MIKVAALTGGRDMPSSRFRFRQHFRPLRDHGLDVTEYCPLVDKNVSALRYLHGKRLREAPLMLPLFFALEAAKLAALLPGVLNSRRYDVVWLERGLYDGMLSFEYFLHKPLVLDVDDAVWHSPPFGEKQMRLTAQRADKILAGNAYLAEWFGRYNRNIEIVPTAVDTEHFFPAEVHEPRPFTVGWTGTSGNFNYLYAIGGALKRFFADAPQAKLLVVADRFPEDLDLPPERLQSVKWTESNEADAVRQMDIGLMPLADDSWTRGKCSFKMLQYMACGIPVVVSPVGMNAEILAKGKVGLAANGENEWLDALTGLYGDAAERAAMGREGRRIAERDYSREVVGRMLAQQLKSLV